jgi:CRP-like cAMP-binding protein
MQLPAGTTVFDPDHPPRGVLLLRAGRIQIWSGRDAVIDHLVPGDFFGEQRLLGRSERNQVARTLSPVKISIYGQRQFRKRLREDRRFVLRFLRNIAVRMDRLEQTICDFVAAPAESRLARLLFRFAPARPTSEWVRLLFSPSNSALAKAIGTTRWRIAHFMSRFQQQGWLRRRPDLWVRYESLLELVESGETGKRRRERSRESLLPGE